MRASALLRATAQTLYRNATQPASHMATVSVPSCMGGVAFRTARVGGGATRRAVFIRTLVSTSWRPAPSPRPPGAAAASAGPDAAPTSPNLPPPLTVTHLPPSSSPPTTSDLANAFAACGFSDVKSVQLDADHALSSHATPVPKLLGVSAGRFLISVDPDAAEDGESGSAGARRDEAAALQLGTGTFLLMPAGVRHSAWVVGGVPVELVMGSRPASP